MRSVILRWCVASIALTMLTSTARADAISSYTVTDLGPAGTGNATTPDYTLSNTGASGTLTTRNGTVYAFPRTDNSVANPQSLLDTLPPLTNAPINDPLTHGNPNFAYSHFDLNGVFLNKEGVFAATDLTGVSGYVSESSSIVDMATRQANGTFGPLTALWNSPNDGSSFQGWSDNSARVLDLNNAGQLLGADNSGHNIDLASPGYRVFFVYDPHSGIKTEIASLLPTGWGNGYPVALDDQGRILLYASTAENDWNNSSLLLLTPAGLSSTPLPAPEPTTLATLAVAGFGLAIRRRWKS
jgi:hypothetical protein